MSKKQTFETRMKRLAEIVARLERDEPDLEEGVALYKEGGELAKACAKELETAKNEIKVLAGDLLTAFDTDSDAESGPEAGE